MKVLHVYRTYFPDSQGGLEEVIRQICLNTRGEGVESRVFTLADNPDPPTLDRPEGRVVRIRKTLEIASNSIALGGMGEFRRQVAWADLVHYHFPWPWADVMHTLAGRPANAVVTYHSDIVRQRLLGLVYRPLMRHFLSGMARIVATSPNYRVSSEVLRRYSDKVEVIPVGLDEDAYPVLDPRGEMVECMAQRHGRDFFFFIGVLRYYKGLHILLQALKDAPYRVVIAGSGPEEAALKRQARELGLDNVEFCGRVSDEEKMALFGLCRAVVLPSHLRSEAFGVSLLEGAMCGRALVSAEVGTGTSFINVDGETGLVVTPGSVASLREALDRLHGNPGEADAMGERARRHFESGFTGAIMGRKYADLYRRLLLEQEPRLAADRAN